MKSQCLCLSLFLLKCTSLDATKDDIYQWEDANIPAIIQRKRGAPPFPALPTGPVLYGNKDCWELQTEEEGDKEKFEFQMCFWNKVKWTKGDQTHTIGIWKGWASKGGYYQKLIFENGMKCDEEDQERHMAVHVTILPKKTDDEKIGLQNINMETKCLWTFDLILPIEKEELKITGFDRKGIILDLEDTPLPNMVHFDTTPLLTRLEKVEDEIANLRLLIDMAMQFGEEESKETKALILYKSSLTLLESTTYLLLKTGELISK